MLQKRLQQALQMHLQPRTSVNTESPADRTLRLLDSLLQVRLVERLRDLKSLPWIFGLP